MINLIKKENINLSILETDFDVFADVINTFTDENFKKSGLIDLDDHIIPEYFRDKMSIVLQTNGMLIGYSIFEFSNINNSSNVIINKLYVEDRFKNKGMEQFIIEGVTYVSSEVGTRCVTVTVDDDDLSNLQIYKSLGFYESGLNENGTVLTINVSSLVNLRKLNDKFRNIPKDSVDYRNLKIIKKITTGRSGNIYLTEDGKILKMFTSNSFTFIKDREETLKSIMMLNIPEIIKPKNLVYYDGIFVGYIMEYLPEGDSLWNKIKDMSFEEKISKIKDIEILMKKLHSKDIYICDLNPDNIFFDSNNNIRLIDCDSFVVKKNVINTLVANKFKDPVNIVVNEKSDLYAFAVTILELLVGNKISDNSSVNDIVKYYNKYKHKVPVSFKDYFDKIFINKERIYLTDSYENYINDIYNANDTVEIENKSGNITVIILSILLLAIAIFGYIVFKTK